MSTIAQINAYGRDHGTQSQRVLAYVQVNHLCTIDEMKQALGIPKSTVTARLSDHLKSGAIGQYEPETGNTQYFGTTTISERHREAHKYQKRNHPVTKLWKRLEKEGRGSQSIHAHLMAVYNELEGTNFQP